MSIFIPSDVVDLVLKHLHDDREEGAGKAFTNALLVCSQWHDIGVRILWTDIILDGVQTMANFVSTNPQRNLEHIRSLTVTFAEKEDHFTPTTSVSWCIRDSCLETPAPSNYAIALFSALRRISGLTSLMTALNVFSFYIKAPRDFRASKSFAIPHNILRNMITSLPPSLRHLEFDTKGYDHLGGIDHRLDICSAVGEKISQLISLRLRLRCICANFLRPSSSLESLVVNIIDRNGEVMDSTCDSKAKYQRIAGGSLDKSLIQSLKMKLEDMPMLQSCILVDSQNQSSHALQIRMMNNRDILKNRTRSYPSFRVAHYPRDLFQIILRIRDAEQQLEDIVGKVCHVDEVVENNVWLSTVAGVRVPVLLKDTPEGRRHQWSEQRKYETKPEFLRGTDLWSAPGARVWSVEDRIGRQVVTDRVVEGVDDIEPLDVIDWISQ